MTETANRTGSPGFGSLWVSALFPLLNLFVFAPATIYLANTAEFELGPWRLLLPLAAAAVVLALALAAALRTMPSAVRRVAVSLLFALGLLLWFQGAFLMHDYGPLDGRGIDWSQFGGLVGADVLLWLVVLLAALIWAGRLSRVAAFGAGIFMGIQFMPLLVDSDRMLAATGGLEAPDDIPGEILAYSSERNIVHVVLDNFQSDVFLELVEDMALESAFDGFTVYPENTAVAPHTSLAVPAIASGRVPDGSQTPDAYFSSAMEQGLYARLSQAGYRVNLLPLLDMSKAPATHYYPVPKVYVGGTKERSRREMARLVDVALFRQLPHRLRRWAYNENNWRVSALVNPGGGKNVEHRRFLAGYIKRIGISDAEPAYHFLHLWPPHPPFSTDQSGRPAGRVLPNTRENYVNEARPMVGLLARFLERLKSMGVYDESLVIFQSDHGGGFEPEYMPTRLLGLLAIKPPGSRGALRRSPLQTSVADVASTVLEHAGLEQIEGFGPTVGSLAPGDRQRRFVFLQNGKLNEVKISGSVTDPASFGPVEQIETVERSLTYQPGTRVQAGLVGEAGRYLGRGWSSPHDRLVWNHGHEATLQLELPPVDRDLVLSMEFIPNVDADKHPKQRIGVEVNGRSAGEWVAREKRRIQIEASVPMAWLDRPVTEIRLILPDAASPAELGTGGDRRDLAVALMAFSLKPVSQKGTGEGDG